MGQKSSPVRVFYFKPITTIPLYGHVANDAIFYPEDLRIPPLKANVIMRCRSLALTDLP